MKANQTNSYLFNMYLVGRVFANSPEDRALIPDCAIVKIKKWYLITPCLTLSIIRYESRVKRSNLGRRVAPPPNNRCSSYLKGSLLIAFNYGYQLYLYMYKEDLVLNNPQWLICHKAQPNQIIYI